MSADYPTSPDDLSSSGDSQMKAAAAKENFDEQAYQAYVQFQHQWPNYQNYYNQQSQQFFKNYY